MATSRVIDHLRRAVRRDESDGSDRQLLARFIETGDEAAFEALVRRHGPMVLGVCRRVLRHLNDAEDAFQASFLVLVRKAASIEQRETIAGWLYLVAYNTARKARATRLEQETREKQMLQLPESEAPAQESLCPDLQRLLDQELSRLPDKYRSPLVLCDLEGMTRKEAARQLGLNEGTISSRLARAKAMLAKRLARRGVVVSGGALVLALSQNVSACVPTTMVYSTVKAATLFAANPAAAAGGISATVVALTEGVLKTMWLTKRTMATLLLSMACVIGSTGLFAYHTLGAAPSDAVKALKADKKAEAPATDKQKMQGTWEVVSLVVDGAKVLPNIQGKGRVIIKGDKLSFLVLEKSTDGEKSRKEFTISLDPSKKPKKIETTPLDGPDKGKNGEGIYELDGDKLKICLLNDPSGKKVTRFDAGTGSGHCLFTLKRSKP